MLGFLQIFLILMLQLNIVLNVVLDLLMLLCKCPLEVIDFVLLHFQVIADPRVVLLIALQFFLEDSVLLVHLVDKGLHLNNLPVDLRKSGLVVLQSSRQLLNLKKGLIFLSLKPVVLVQQFLVIAMER